MAPWPDRQRSFFWQRMLHTSAGVTGDLGVLDDPKAFLAADPGAKMNTSNCERRHLRTISRAIVFQSD
jgi:hypothetical protein